MAKKILVADDDFNDLKDMKNLLEKNGFEAVTVTNGAQALDTMEEHEFDLLLIDVQMPTLSGYDLLRLSRERLEHKIPMMFVSIVPEREVDLHDADGFIQKPYTEEDFVAKVNEVLSQFKPKE